ncbi:hypothetical protein BGP_6610 [Beggiatoa sp. PS]|nr:hypothetical protein BGP_6610 [Beggiatoa sp. PS]
MVKDSKAKALDSICIVEFKALALDVFGVQSFSFGVWSSKL